MCVCVLSIQQVETIKFNAQSTIVNVKESALKFHEQSLSINQKHSVAYIEQKIELQRCWVVGW